MSDVGDRDLRGMFDALRTAQDDFIPSFEAMVDPAALREARRRNRRRRFRTAVAGGGVAGVMLVFVLGPDAFLANAGRGGDSDASVPAALSLGIDLGSVYWRAPSDFLLDTPGRELLRGVPTFTTSAARAAAPPAAAPMPESTSTRSTRGRSHS